MSGLALTVSEIKNQNFTDINTQIDIKSERVYFSINFPYTIKALQKIDNETIKPKRRKGFNLKKIGNNYFARYSYNGSKIPTYFSTHTEDEKAAEKYARENKSRLIESYLARKNGKMFKILQGFYDDKPEHLNISDRIRKEYKAVIINKFIPFLKSEKILSFQEIKHTTFTKFQIHLLTRDIKAQTVNNNMKAVKKVFARLAMKEVIAENPADRVKGLPVSQADKKARGCYEIEKLKGVFNKKWEDERSLLLNLLIYTTGMRNGEIKRIKMNDIQIIEGCRFIKISESKTASGVRLVPLHDFVYRKLRAWTLKNKKEKQLFDFSSALPFIHANSALGRMLNVSDEELERENITFYSGRHYWKTLMNCEGLGEDVEEIFMGHKVSSNVAKLYNHLDKRGKSRMAEKAKQEFQILDSYIFKTKQ